ncbi:hypothetical protein [Kurthia senegalensis]|uniref:hypothetical protein n=1 Tax=Kurthia senegalensis TaxID=1033740 RepID=UPI000289BACB|nr:hypothetical protein [Kurthia senegalensis]
MGNNKMIKTAAAVALGASVVATAVAPGAASAATTYKLKSGKLVNAKTGKVVKGYKVYKSTLYKDGKKAKGYVTFNKVLYKDGKKFTGLRSAKYYKAGKLATGTFKGVYYKTGKKFTGLKSGVYYKAGVKGTGLYKSVYYKNGKKGTALVGGVYYKNGAKGTGSYKGIQYKAGKAVTGVVNNVYYNNGVKATAVVDGVQYVDGDIANEVYKKVLYVDGKAAQGTVEGVLYKDGKKVTGEVEGVLYEDGKAFSGVKEDKVYVDGKLDAEAPAIEVEEAQTVAYGATAPTAASLVKSVKDNSGEKIEATATITFDGKEVSAIDTKVAGEYTINYVAVDKNGNEGKASVKVTVQATTKAEVESVTAINAKQIKVKFSKAVGNGVTTPANYEVKTVAGATANTVTSVTVVDDKTVILNLTSGYTVSTDLVVSISGIYEAGSIKETLPKYSTVINVNDTKDPEVESVSSKTSTNAAQVVTVKLSEPIQSAPAVKINGNLISTGVSLDATGTILTISGLNLAADKTHSLEVLNYKDFANNSVVYTKKDFSITKDTTVATGKAAVLQDNKVQVTFDKAITAASLANVDILRYDSTTGEYKKVALDTTTPYAQDTTGKIATFNIAAAEETNFFGLNDSKEELIVKVKSGVVDTTGNAVTPFEEKVVANQDVTGPALQEVTFKKDSKGAVTALYFTYNEDLTFGSARALAASEISYTDVTTNNTVDLSTVFGTAPQISLATDGKTLVVTPDTGATQKFLSGSYSFTAAAALAKDTSFAQNDNTRGSKTVDFGQVANQVSVSSASINTLSAVDNKLTITFSKAVTAASAKDPANYSINGKTLPATTVIKVVNDTTVEFTLPSDTVAKSDGSAVLAVDGVKAQDSSATFKAYVGTINALDNTRPVATSTLLSNGLIQLTFSEAVTAAAADFKTLTLNGKEIETTTPDATVVTVNTTASLLDGTPAVTIAVVPKVAADFNSTGFTYQYIDVDGNDALDFNKDIILNKVEATTAPASWSTIANLNLLDSVTIELPAAPATVDGSTVNLGSGAGNTLAPATTITVK